MKEFLNNTIHRLGETRAALLLADRGFCNVDFLEGLEERNRHYGCGKKALRLFARHEKRLSFH